MNGIRIKNYEAASIYEHYWGIRSRLDSTDAMLVDSLFKDYLEPVSRDVICLAFSYRTKGLDELKEPDKVAHPEKAVVIDRQRLREMAYKDGVTIRYYDGEEVHYKMLYRTAGKAKKGTCMFIRDSLYEKAHDYLWMGIKLPDKKAPIVQMGAYSSLITSGIVSKIQIKPEQILVLPDVKSEMQTDVIMIDTDKAKHCQATKKDGFTLSNVVFDGQALIDMSIFPSWADGYILLRNHMTKCAAFNTNIALFMRERFGAEYETATVKDMWGRDVRVRDIKLICTESTCKWLTFGVSFDYWAEWIRKNDCMWGIVKTTHESKLGDVQRMSYQMVNALDIGTMPEVTQRSVSYIDRLKKDDDAFLDFLRKNANFANDFDVLLAIVRQCPDFINSEYFRDRRQSIIGAYVINFKSGRVIQNADNLTIVGSPYAMLLHSVGDDIEDDPTFDIEDGAMQCWTERFRDREYLAGFRSPFNSRNNLGYLHNVYHPYFDRYFRLGKLCIAVNMQHTCFQDRNNGSDQDSDSLYVTNHPDIAAHAKYCMAAYPTIVNCIPKEKNIYNNRPEDYAKIDNRLAASQVAIGQSSNLAQIALTYTYNFKEQKYNDYVCILSVVAQLAIDSAKRSFDVDIPAEINRIKQDMEIGKNGLPFFWQITKKDKRKARTDEIRTQRAKENKEKIVKKINKDLICPMNFIYSIQLKKYKSDISTKPTKDFIVRHRLDGHRKMAKKIEQLIEKYSFKVHAVEMQDDMWYDNNDLLLMDDFEELISDIRSSNMSGKYVGLMSWLIDRAFHIPEQTKNSHTKLDKNRPLLLRTLYEVNPKSFLRCFKGFADKNQTSR